MKQNFLLWIQSILDSKSFKHVLLGTFVKILAHACQQGLTHHAQKLKSRGKSQGIESGEGVNYAKEQIKRSKEI